MNLLNFSIIKLTLCLITGILLGSYFEGLLFEATLLTIVLILIYGLGIYIAKYQLKQAPWIGIILMLSMTCLGFLSLKLHEQYNFKNHYTNYSNFNKEQLYTFHFRVRETLKSGKFNEKYIIDLLKINTTSISGKLLLNISIDSTNQPLEVDDTFILKTQFKTINSPLNPSQFNYKTYLKKKHIYHQLFATHKTLFKLNSSQQTLFGYAALIRKKVNHSLKPYCFKPDEIAIINALLLGQRQDITKEIYNSYVQAGAIHILAVSGLHIGILLMLLNYLFKPIEHFKFGRTIKTILLVIILWSFAIIAGLSASVVRAVTMFTVVAIAMNLKRPTNIYNTLFISMFILLLCKPTFLFDVGFQLSYLAVFAIVIIQPMLYKLYRPRFKIDHLLWNVLTVTLAAQLGVIPISLYYFHQFPGLFFISNLVIIPFLGIILGFGILMIVLAILQLLPEILASIFGAIISTMNNFVQWISLQENFLFQDISFNIFQLILSYLFLITIILIIKHKTYRRIISFLVIVLLFQAYLLFDAYRSSNHSVIIFHKNRYSILGMRQNRQLTFYHNTPQFEKETLITNYIVAHNLNINAVDSLRNVFIFNEKTLLIVDSLGVYQVNSFKVDFILLRNSPKINLVRLIDMLNPELIVSDGSNFKSYQERWAKTCRVKKIPFHSTYEKGAFIYNY